MNQGAGERVDLSAYWDVVWRRRWLALLILVVVLGSTAYFTHRTPRVYEATAVLMVEEGAETDLFGTRPLVWWQSPRLGNHCEILRSRVLAEMVAERLSQDLVTGLSGSKEPPDLASLVQGSVMIRPVKETDIIRVSARAGDPGIAVRLANLVVETYQDFNLNERRGELVAIREFVGEQLEVIGAQLNNAERQLQEFKETHGIVALSEETRNLIGRYSNFEVLHQNAKNERVETEHRLAHIEKLIEAEGVGMWARLEDISSPLIISFKSTLDRLEVERANLMLQGLTPDNPKIKALDQEITEVKSRMKAEASGLVAREGAVDPMSRLKKLFESAFELRLELEGLRVREEVLARSVRLCEEELRRLPAHERSLAHLEREVEVNRKLYLLLSEKYQEARIREAGRLSVIRVVDWARAGRQVEPKTRTNLILGLLVGLLLSIGTCFGLEYLDTSIKSPKDLERMENLPLLGSIPELEPRRGFFLGRREPPLISHLATHSDPRSAGAEAFRLLRTALGYAALDKPFRSIVVSSPAPLEGKSTVAVNLSTVLAQTGAKTLLVDSDLRRPVLHKVFGCPQDPGLGELVLGTHPLSDLLRPTPVDNLWFITAGTTPFSPADFFDSEATAKALKLLEKEFKFVVYDSAPILGVADTIILASKLSGLVLVVRAGQTTREALERAQRAISSGEARLLGVVLNRVEPFQRYGYYRYYSSTNTRSSRALGSWVKKRG